MTATKKVVAKKESVTGRRIRIGGQLVDYDDASKDVELERVLADVLKAKPGDASNCMNSMCIKAQRNKRLFPHNVWAVSTIKSRVYIVDEIGLKGDEVVFKHAVRYELPQSQSRLIHEHDHTGAGEPGRLRLEVPREPKGTRKDAGRPKNNQGQWGKTGRRDLPVTADHTPKPAKDQKSAVKVKGRKVVDRSAPRPAARGKRGATQRYKVAVGALNI